MKRIKSTLTLNRETLRRLDADETWHVAGGATAGCPLRSLETDCPSWVTCGFCGTRGLGCISAICLPP